jgi:hypothetical protein
LGFVVALILPFILVGIEAHRPEPNASALECSGFVVIAYGMVAFLIAVISADASTMKERMILLMSAWWPISAIIGACYAVFCGARKLVKWVLYGSQNN